MALADDLAELQQAHHRRFLGLQDTAGELLGETWDRFAGLDDVAAARFTSAAAVLRDETTRQVSTLAVGYMRANDRAAGMAAAELVPVLPTIRGGIPAPEVYQRSIVEARRLVSRGGDFDSAMAAGRARAVATARTDVSLANRAEITRGGVARPWVVGYRRVLTGKSCAFCATASTQRYRSADLLPLHPGCDCDVAEIFGTEDPGQIINRELLDELKQAGQADDRARYWSGPYVVDESGAVRFRRIETVRDETGKKILGADGKPLRRSVAGDRVRPEVVEHGELGPVLTDARHATTTPADLAPPDPPELRTRAKVTDPDVLAEATRKEITPEEVLQERSARNERRALEERARRAAARSLDSNSPEVRAVAERFGVDPDDVLSARARVADVRKVAREEAARVQADALRELDRLDAMRLRNPPAPGARTASGGQARRGEWDWLEQVSTRERARLSRQWYGGELAPDQLAENMANALGRDLSVDDAIETWLDLNRRAEAAGALRRGRLPSLDAYSGAVDPTELLASLADEGYDVVTLFGDDLTAAAHIASVEAELVRNEALRYLGEAVRAVEGPAPYRMTFATWEGEVRDLEHALRDGVASAAERRRYAELVPQYLDEPGTSFEDLFARIVSTARKAGEVVADGTVPW